jgi:ribosomal protein L16 Arg81 hydroxylase
MWSTEFVDFLAPMSPDEFVGEYYNRNRAVHIAGTRGRFAHLMPWDELNRVFLQHRLEAPRLRLSLQDKLIPAEEFTTKARLRSGAVVPKVNLDGLTRHLRAGATMVVDRIDEVHEPITSLVRLVEANLSERINSNLYASWYTAPAFSTHWDSHDAIMIQVTGRKSWRLFEPQRRYPVYRDQHLYLTPPTKEPCWQGVLNPGDLLYVPRGWWHDAAPVGEPTIHVTISITRPNGIDLAKWMVEQLHEPEIARTDLPRFGSADERREYLTRFRNAIDSILRHDAVDQYLQEIDGNAPSIVRPSFPWTGSPDCGPLPSDAWLHWLPPRPVRFEESEDRVSFRAMGAQFGFARVAAPLIKGLAEQRRVRLDALCAQHSGISNSAIEKFVLELMGNGLITISEKADCI